MIDTQGIAIKRLVASALIPSLAFAMPGDADEYGFPSFIVLDSAPVKNCLQVVPVQVQYEVPVVAVPQLRKVRRAVPRTTYQTMTKTIMVPTTTLETRQSQSVEHRDEVPE